MKKKRIILIILLIILLASGIGFGFWYKSALNLVYSEVVIEAGSQVPVVEDFLKRSEENVEFSDADFNVNVPGDYELDIKWQMPVFGEKTFKTVLHVVDTTAPVVNVNSAELILFVGDEAPSFGDILESVVDATECTIDFAEEYDFSAAGEFEVKIKVTDTSNNETLVSIPCKVVEDTTAPVISGVEPLTISQGDTVSYKKGITVTDDYDTAPVLEVDSSEVNLDKRGVYNLTYIATDRAGNSSSVTTTVKVVSAKIAEATEATVNAMADKIIASIITDGMTQLEEARAIFDWTVNNITYSETAGIDDLYSAAYAGMYYHKGDCTVKQKTAEVMLNRVGIKNMEIEKIRDTRGHYWLLIDVGEGWYHYDPNLQLDGTLIFYWHDADLWEYSNTHKNTHNYDPSKYPKIQ